jgi:hypothetical protein
MASETERQFDFTQFAPHDPSPGWRPGLAMAIDVFACATSLPGE